MTYYYDISQEDRERIGLDYDLYACLEYNPQDGYSLLSLKKVLAVYEGENDGDSWRWVIELHDGRFVFLIGACDYTGWDCQSWASSTFTTTPEDAAKCALSDDGWRGNQQDVYDSLAKQIAASKSETWREKQDKEEGL